MGSAQPVRLSNLVHVCIQDTSSMEDCVVCCYSGQIYRLYRYIILYSTDVALCDNQKGHAALQQLDENGRLCG